MTPMPCMLQMKKLSPEDGVLVIGNSAEPQACSRKEETALKKLFPSRILVPLPDHASRLVRVLPCCIQHTCCDAFAAHDL